MGFPRAEKNTATFTSIEDGLNFHGVDIKINGLRRNQLDCEKNRDNGIIAQDHCSLGFERHVWAVTLMAILRFLGMRPLS